MTEAKEENQSKPERLLSAALQEEYRTMALCQERKKEADEEYAASSRRAVELEAAIEALAKHKNLTTIAGRYSIQVEDAAEALYQLKEILTAHKITRVSTEATIAKLEMLAGRINLKEKEAPNAGSGN